MAAWVQYPHKIKVWRVEVDENTGESTETLIIECPADIQIGGTMSGTRLKQVYDSDYTCFFETEQYNKEIEKNWEVDFEGLGRNFGGVRKVVVQSIYDADGVYQVWFNEKHT